MLIIGIAAIIYFNYFNGSVTKIIGWFDYLKDRITNGDEADTSGNDAIVDTSADLHVSTESAEVNGSVDTSLKVVDNHTLEVESPPVNSETISIDESTVSSSGQNGTTEAEHNESVIESMFSKVAKINDELASTIGATIPTQPSETRMTTPKSSSVTNIPTTHRPTPSHPIAVTPTTSGQAGSSTQPAEINAVPTPPISV